MKKLNWMQCWTMCALVLICTAAYGNTTVTINPSAKSEISESGTIGNSIPNRQDCTYYNPSEGRWVVVAEYDLKSYKTDAPTLARATLNFGFGPMWGNLGLLRVGQIPSDLQVTAGDYAGTNLGYVVQENGTNGTPSSFSVDVTALVKTALPLAGDTQGIAFRFDDTLGASDPFWGGGSINSPQLILEFASSPATLSPTVFGNVAENGSLSNPVYPDRTICYKELDGLGGYVWHDAAEFDISPIKGNYVSRATLTFTIGPDWGPGADMNMDVAWGAASDLQLTGADGLRWGTPFWSSWQNTYNTGGPPWNVTYTVDVTNQLRQALPGSSSTSGLFFKWYSNQARLGNARTLGFDFGGTQPSLNVEYELLDRGHQRILNHGLQIQAWAFPESIGSFNLTNWNQSNFTTLNTWYFPFSDLAYLPPAPGIPWSREIGINVGLVGGETPLLGNLVSLQVDDEQDLTLTNIAAIATHIAFLKTNYPSAIIHTNQAGSKASVTQLQDYMRAAQPDLLMFDTYPFNGSVPGGSPTELYQNMQKYRLLGLAGNDGTGTWPIPYALFTQTYLASGHSPSDSEMRLNEFSAWAFGFKMVSAFLYENAAQFGHGETTSLFSANGDNNPTSHFYELAETNRQSKNLGPALVRLLSTDVRMIMGQYWGKNNWWEENHTIDTTAPAGITTGITGADPYIIDITATNAGSKNNGKRGDVIVGFFKPLHPSFEGYQYPDEKYFMVVNGLSDAGGTAAETRQNIHITFNLPANITSLQRLSRQTGQVEVVPLVNGGLDLVLDGGTGDLFKYNTGAPFVGVTQVQTPTVHGTVTYTDYPGYPLNTVTVEIRNGATVVETYPALTLTGSSGSKTYSFNTSLTGPYTLALVKNAQTGWKEAIQPNITISGDTTVNFTVTHTIAGDASMDGKVDVSDLGILAANYGGTGKTWDQGDFSGDGKVDVSDLGILAAHYGQGSGGVTQAGDFPQDMKALGLSFDSNTDEPAETQKTQTEENPVARSLGGCGSAGLPLVAGIFLAGLLLSELRIKE